MPKTVAPRREVLLTGVTGFVGKVVLEELLRRREELSIAAVHVVIRPERRRDGTVRSPSERFHRDVVTRELFAGHEPGWEKWVHVVAGELAQPDCGIEAAELARLTDRVTHVIHCAASVDFDLPIAQAAESNITAALNVLDIAKRCPGITSMVDVSTTYVTPWRPGPIGEELAHLPRPAEDLLAIIASGHADEAALKAETGHPNTYALTKCIVEHLLSQRHGHVPLTIVRPSVVSASWQRPFPGWVDSPAAYAGCMLYLGLGAIKAFQGHPSVRLDVIPVDEVSTRIIDACLVDAPPVPTAPVRIVQACSGYEKATRLDLSDRATVRYFSQRPGALSVSDPFLGTDDHGFATVDFLRRAVPTAAKKVLLKATGRTKDLGRLSRADEKIRYMNACFKYFTHHTFDFRSSKPFNAPDFRPEEYVNVVSAGLYRHLLRRDETELTLAGEAHDDARNDFQWVTEKPSGGWAVRSLGFGLRKVLRRATTQVTWDRPSFEEAMRAVPPGTTVVLAPSHRSYFDFLLMSYLCFQHPELGIPVPHIAAAEEFSRIPFVGPLLEQSQAFFIKRGVGQEVPEVTAQMLKLTQQGASLLFFVEGKRSRTRQYLPPRRGLLRALQKSGRPCVVLPVGLSYDRVPEESAFEKELRGAPKPGMSLRAVLGWLSELAKGDVQLGRAHIACGTPLRLNADSDVVSLSEQIVAEHQRVTAVTTFHLRAFLAHARLPDVTEQWLADAIAARGGRVLESPLEGAESVPSSTRMALQYSWEHWFYEDARALAGLHPAVEAHIARHGWTKASHPGDTQDVRVRSLVAALFEPIQADYALAARVAHSTPRAVLQDYPSAQLANLEDAFATMEQRGLLSPHADSRATYAKGVSQSVSVAIAKQREMNASPQTSRVSQVS